MLIHLNFKILIHSSADLWPIQFIHKLHCRWNMLRTIKILYTVERFLVYRHHSVEYIHFYRHCTREKIEFNSIRKPSTPLRLVSRKEATSGRRSGKRKELVGFQRRRRLPERWVSGHDLPHDDRNNIMSSSVYAFVFCSDIYTGIPNTSDSFTKKRMKRIKTQHRSSLLAAGAPSPKHPALRPPPDRDASFVYVRRPNLPSRPRPTRAQKLPAHAPEGDCITQRPPQVNPHDPSWIQ